jgi:type VI secretion system secreted protein Hcp
VRSRGFFGVDPDKVAQPKFADFNIDTKRRLQSTFAAAFICRVVNLDDGLFRCIQMASDIFAKIGDIKGESRDDKHTGEIEVLSFSWGVTNTANPGGGGGGAGRATFQDLSFTHTIDKASPNLLKACATGSHLKEATITHRKAGKGQQEFLIIKMNDVIITGVSLGDSSGGSGSENVTLAFAKVDLEYKPQKPDGSLDTGVHFKFDIKSNKEG